MKNKKIVFLGTSDFAATIFEYLIQKKYNFIAAITQPDKPSGRKKILTPPPVKLVAQKYDIPILQPNSLKNSEFSKTFKSLNPDLGIVIAYGKIIPKEIIEIPNKQMINVHPSLLPKYRGPSPIQSAIKNLDAETGVSIMLIDEHMDHGPILAQEKISIEPDDTSDTLRKRVIDITCPLLDKVILEWLEDKITPKEQDHEKATIIKMIKKEDGRIQWNRPSKVIDAMIRAYTPWPNCFTTFERKGKNSKLKIIKTKITKNLSTEESGSIVKGSKSLMVATSDYDIELISVQPEGKKIMSGTDFSRGYQNIENSKLV